MSISKIVLGMQSFRCSEALIGGLYGVTFTRIGYSGGVKLHPTYRRIGDHTEVVEVHYNTKLITLSDILEVFFENHDYSAVFPSRYMSSVFYTDERQKDETEYFIKHNLEGDVATVVKPLTSYHDAEHIYHKYYLQNVPTLMLQLLYEYQWDWKTWFKEFNVLPFVTKLNAAVSGLFPLDYVDSILDGINIPDGIKADCRLHAAHTRPRCLLM
ncbi:hypothetical protein WA171_003973 [Blastocystis sp. BT1]